MTKIQRAFFELHIAVVLWGFTAILGHLIQLSALTLVWWRLFITCSVVLLRGGIFAEIQKMPRKLILKYIWAGILVTMHWICFYAAIKLANASVALICLATTSFQSALLEPLMTGQRIKWYEVALGVLIVPGMVYIAGDLPSSMTAGLWVGMMSSVFVVVFSILNKKLIDKAEPMAITLIELGGGLAFLTILMPFYLEMDAKAEFFPHPSDWFYLIILAVFCTNVAYWLSLRSLKHLSAFATNLTINLEPVYGITLAWLLLHENKQLTPSFYIGASMILIAVLSYPILRGRFELNDER